MIRNQEGSDAGTHTGKSPITGTARQCALDRWQSNAVGLKPKNVGVD